LGKQTADLHCLETALLRARETAEELGEIVIVYFIDMALAETRTKNPPPAKDNKPRTDSRLRALLKKRDRQTLDLDILSVLALDWLRRCQTSAICVARFIIAARSSGCLRRMNARIRRAPSSAET
jgi:hypothetical protein